MKPNLKHFESTVEAMDKFYEYLLKAYHKFRVTSYQSVEEIELYEQIEKQLIREGLL